MCTTRIRVALCLQIMMPVIVAGCSMASVASPTPTLVPGQTAQHDIAGRIREAVESTSNAVLSSYELRYSQLSETSDGEKTIVEFGVIEAMAPAQRYSIHRGYEVWHASQKRQELGFGAIPIACRNGTAYEPGGEEFTVGSVVYQGVCNGSWFVFARQEPLNIRGVDGERRWFPILLFSSMKDPSLVREEMVGDIVTEVFQGRVIDGDDELGALLYVDREDKIIRRLELLGPGASFLRAELHAVNDESISFEPPSCSTVVTLPPLWQMEKPTIPEDGCWFSPSIHPF